MIKITQKGNYSKVTKYLQQLKKRSRIDVLRKYGQEGVNALSSATPVDSGLTAASWSYEIVDTKTGSELVFHNSNVNNGVVIAIILQYGHGTGTGVWINGRDYINPAIQPIFNKIADEVWKEVSSL